MVSEVTKYHHPGQTPAKATATNVWEAYGFVHNPFDTQALSPFSPSLFPIGEAFVPRLADMRTDTLLRNILASAGGARLVVEGDIGVGKTTFVNYHRYFWHTAKERALFTTVHEISLSPNWSLKDFLLNLLANLMDALLLQQGEKAVKGNKVFREVLLLSKVFWEFEKSVQGSLQFGLAGIGGGYGQQSSLLLPNMPEIQLFIYFQNMVQEILKLGFRGILIHLDNLEVASRKNPEQTKDLFEVVRDTLQSSHVYFIVVGHKGFFYQIISPLERVRSIFFGYPISLAPLTLVEVFEVLARRYRLLAKQGKQFRVPVENELVEYLYQVYHGKLRFIMDAINSLVYQISPDMVKTFTLQEGRNNLELLTREKIKPLLTPQEWETMQECIRLQRFQNADLSRNLRLPRQNISRILRHFLDLNLIYPESTEGNKIFYQLSDELLILTPEASRINIVMPAQAAEIKFVGNERQETAIAFVKQHGSLTVKQYMELTQASRATAKRDLSEMLKYRLLIRRGATRNLRYLLPENSSGSPQR